MFSHTLCCLLILELIVVSSAGIPPSDNETKEEQKDSEGSQSLHALERLAKSNRQAYIIWNVTNNYIHSEKINETCVTELQKDSKLIPFYLVNITLRESQTILQLNYFGSDMWLFEHNQINHHAQFLHDNRTKILADQEIYLSTIEDLTADFLDESNENICVSDSLCGCISRRHLRVYISFFPNYKEHTHRLWNFIVFKSYVEPFFRIIVIIIGMILNSTLLFIFIREKSMRTESNILILNLVISNIITLLAYIPSNYISKYVSAFEEGHEFTAIEVLTVSGNALTILFLNIQRYFQVSWVLNGNDRSCVSTPSYRCAIYLAVLWTWSIVFAIFLGVIDPMSGLVLGVLLYFLIYIFVFSVVMSIFNSLTTRKLHRAAKEGKTSTEFQHITGSGVILCLTIVYYSTHIPFYIYRVFETVAMGMLTNIFIPTTFRIIIFFLHLVFFSYPCVNVFVLYKASSAYRNLFNKYLFRFWYSPGESKYVTMSSVRNIDPEE